MEANPVAFVTEAAAQAEEDYRSAAQEARNRLTMFSSKPDNPKISEQLTESIESLRKERPFFSHPRPAREVTFVSVHLYLGCERLCAIG